MTGPVRLGRLGVGFAAVPALMVFEPAVNTLVKGRVFIVWGGERLLATVGVGKEETS